VKMLVLNSKTKRPYAASLLF